MVIGVDAAALSATDERLHVGVYRVIYYLLKELSRIDMHNQYRLYSFDPIPDTLLDSFSPIMSNLVLKPKTGWASLRLPLSLLNHPVDVYLGLAQAIPFGAGKSIGLIHDLGFLHYPKMYPQSYRRLVGQTKSLVHRSSRILAVSKSTKQDVITTYQVKEDSIVVARPGIDTDRFTPKGDVFVSHKPYFLHVGSLKPGKNIPQLILGFSQFIRTTNSDYLLLLIGGDYWMDEEILSTIEACGMGERVRLLGHVPDAVLAQYYRGATAFVTLSLWEGFCLPVVEAMACGIPVISSNTGALPEIVPDTSLICDPRDLSRFSENIHKVASDHDFRDAVVAKGIAKSQEYTWKSFAQTVLDTIETFRS